MTKRALAVIALLMMIPVAVTLVFWSRWKTANPVIAEWGKSTDTVKYRSVTLKRVYGSDRYVFRTGKYLGKISDRLTGASLYRVSGDDSGELFAVVTSGSAFLFTADGTLPGRAYSGARITCAFIDGPENRTSDEGVLAALTEAVQRRETPEKLTQPKKGPALAAHTVYLCFDGFPVSTVRAGDLIGPTDRGRWYFAPYEEESAEQTGKETGEGITAYEIQSRDDINLIKSLFSTDSGTEESGSEVASGTAG